MSCSSFQHFSGLNAVVKSNSDITWRVPSDLVLAEEHAPCAALEPGQMNKVRPYPNTADIWWIPVLISKVYSETEVGADGWKGWQGSRRHDVLETVSWQVLRGPFALFLSGKVWSCLIWRISLFETVCEFCTVGIFWSLKWWFFHEAVTVWHCVCSSCVWTETILG